MIRSLRKSCLRECRNLSAVRLDPSAPGDVLPDNRATFRGMGLKVIGVKGTKVLPDEADAVMQDFLLVSFPVIAGGDVSSFLKLQLLLEQTAKQVEDASKEWLEKESPYQPVGKITLPRQETYSPGR